MIKYVVAQNPDDRILKRASALLVEGNLIALPTDTNWAFICDVESKKGTEALYALKHVSRKKHLSLICESISQAARYAHIDDAAFRYIKPLLPGPYTFIFLPNRHLPKAIDAYRKDRQIGIRIPNSILCQRLVKIHDRPVLCSSITPDLLKQEIIDPELLVTFTGSVTSFFIEEVWSTRLKMIIDPGEYVFHGPTTVVDCSGEEFQIVRPGAEN